MPTGQGFADSDSEFRLQLKPGVHREVAWVHWPRVSLGEEERRVRADSQEGASPCRLLPQMRR